MKKGYAVLILLWSVGSLHAATAILMPSEPRGMQLKTMVPQKDIPVASEQTTADKSAQKSPAAHLLELHKLRKLADKKIGKLGEQLREIRDLDKRSDLIKQWNEQHIARNKVDKKVARLQQEMRQATRESVEQQLIKHEIKRANPLVILSQQPSKDWDLNDDKLAYHLSFVLRDKQLLEAIQTIRQKEVEKWRKWRTLLPEATSATDEAYQDLHQAMVAHMKKHLKEQKIIGEGVERLAEEVIKGHIGEMVGNNLGDTSFVTEMVARIAGSAGATGRPALEHYRKLFLLVLGYDFKLSSFHAEKLVRAVHDKKRPLTDLQTMRQAFARILIAYRASYDRHYHGLVVDLEDTFMRSQIKADSSLTESLIKEWLQEWQEAAYLRPLEPFQPKDERAKVLYQQWRDLLVKTQAQAHKYATSNLDSELADVWDGMRSLVARLTLLQVSGADFRYPADDWLSNDKLSSDQTYSILIGLLLRCIEYRMVKVKALNPTVLQTIMANEMRAQHSSEHLRKQLPPGKDISDLGPELGAKMRKSYEAKMYTMIGKAMDVYNGVGEQESNSGLRGPAYAQVPIDKALMAFNKTDGMGDFSVQRGVLLFAQILDMYGELNAAVWRVSSKKTVKQLRKELTVKQYEVERYLLSMGIDLRPEATPDFREIYHGVLARLIPWKKSKISYEEPASLRKELAKFSEAEKTASYQATYQLLWLCIWQRLRTVIKVDSGYEAVSRLFAKNTLVSQSDITGKGGKGDKKETGTASALVRRFSALKNDAQELPYQLRQVARGLLTQGKSLRTELRDNFSRTGDLSGVANHVSGILSNVNSILPGVNKVLVNVYKQGNSTYGELMSLMKARSEQMLAMLKALTTYVYHLNRYATRKINKAQRAIDKVLNSTAIRVASRLGAKMIGDDLREAFKEVEGDASIERDMRASLSEFEEAAEGRRTPDQVTGIPEKALSSFAGVPLRGVAAAAA